MFFIPMYFYFRYAFLRCEDEREQCLYYLQTLNTVDFSCFTNAYSKSSILYQVLIFPSQKSAGASITSANVWLHVVGSLAESPVLRFVYIPIYLALDLFMKLSHYSRNNSFFQVA